VGKFGRRSEPPLTGAEDDIPIGTYRRDPIAEEARQAEQARRNRIRTENRAVVGAVAAVGTLVLVAVGVSQMSSETASASTAASTADTMAEVWRTGGIQKEATCSRFNGPDPQSVLTLVGFMIKVKQDTSVEITEYESQAFLESVC
jgi:hypothetical protein